LQVWQVLSQEYFNRIFNGQQFLYFKGMFVNYDNLIEVRKRLRDSGMCVMCNWWLNEIHK
jgi:hypothetical protein